MPIDETAEFKPIRIAVLTVSDSRTRETDKSGGYLCEALQELGHTLADYALVPDDQGAILGRLHQWVDDQSINCILISDLRIGMLLAQDPELLLVDEPVAGMTDHETERTAELFLTLKGKHSLMVVEHDMGFIRTISDIVTVLCDGSVLAQGTLDQVQADERVIEVYLGR